jgi:hypothetical protein
MKHEYHEGPQACENFKKFATAVFQAKKTTVPAKPTTVLLPFFMESIDLGRGRPGPASEQFLAVQF